MNLNELHTHSKLLFQENVSPGPVLREKCSWAWHHPKLEAELDSRAHMFSVLQDFVIQHVFTELWNIVTENCFSRPFVECSVSSQSLCGHSAGSRQVSCLGTQPCSHVRIQRVSTEQTLFERGTANLRQGQFCFVPQGWGFESAQFFVVQTCY